MDEKMSFASFTEKLVETLREKLEETHEIPEPLMILKNNGERLTGIAPRTIAGSVSPTIYVEPIYQDYHEGASFDDCVSKTLKIINSEIPDEIRDIGEKLHDQSFLESHLRLKVISADANEELLKTSVYRQIEDLACIAVIRVDSDGEGIGTIRITPELLSEIKMTKDEVLRTALKNNDAEAYHVLSIGETLRELIGEDIPEEMAEMLAADRSPMYVLTNAEKTFGAAVLASKEQLTKAVEVIGEDCFILPSSVHEILLVPKSKAPTLEELRDMVREVNLTQVPPEEILSNEVYSYSAKDQKLTIAGEELVKEITENAPHKGLHI